MCFYRAGWRCWHSQMNDCKPLKLKFFYWALKSNKICSSIRWGHSLLHLGKCQDTKLPDPPWLWKLPSCISRKLSLFIKHCVTDRGDFFKNVSDEQNELPGISLPGWLNTHQVIRAFVSSRLDYCSALFCWTSPQNPHYCAASLEFCCKVMLTC